MKRLLALAVLAALATPASAQRLLDPDWNWHGRDSYFHATAGALIDVSMRAGYIAPSWRKSPIKRVALVVLVGAAYEGVETLSAWENKTSGTRGYGFGFKDLLCDAAGAVAVELVVAIGKKVF
jgi:opacity protein-like surface antigen